MMTNTEIKKSLYKEKPVAKLVNKASNGDLTYETILSNNFNVSFLIPKNETVDADGKYLFESEMDAKLLNRWINN